MISRVSCVFFLFFTCLFTSCTTLTKKPQPIDHEARRLAEVRDEPEVKLLKSRSKEVYSWTNPKQTPVDAKAEVERNLERTRNCLRQFQIRSHEAEITGCEGEGFYAGPGLYVVDDPFTSLDYGSTVISVELENNRPLAFSTGNMTEGIPQSVYRNPLHEGILYNFRYTGLHGYALVIRNPNLIKMSTVQAFSVNQHAPKRFAEAREGICTDANAVSETLEKWSDHLVLVRELFTNTKRLHKMVDGFPEFDSKTYIENGHITDLGWAAAIASDAVYFPEKDIVAKITNLAQISGVGKIPEMCRSIGERNQKVCLFRLIFDSLIENVGSDNDPAAIWENVNTLRRVLRSLGIQSAEADSATTVEKFREQLISSYRQQATVSANIRQIVQCAQKSQRLIRPNHFGGWVNEFE